MKSSTIAITLLSGITGSNAWRNFKAVEFESGDCTGKVNHASIGSRPEYWQIHMSNKTNSIYTSTPNDGMYIWYAYSGADESGCDGDVVRRLSGGCINLANDSEKIKCVRWCSNWADDKYSCKEIKHD